MTIWNAQGVPSLSPWRSVFDRLAPASIPTVEAAIAPVPLGQGKVMYAFTPAVLAALLAAYGEAAASLGLSAPGTERSRHVRRTRVEKRTKWPTPCTRPWVRR